MAMDMRWEMFFMRRVDAVSRLEPHAHDKTHVCVNNCGEVRALYRCVHVLTHTAGTLESNLAPVPVLSEISPAPGTPFLHSRAMSRGPRSAPRKVSPRNRSGS